MSETKRRPKSAEQENDDSGSSAPRRQTRVTLAKDVSSRYRKLMPESKERGAAKGGPRDRRSEKGSSGADRRKRDDFREGERPRFRDDERPRRDRTTAAGGGRDWPGREDGERGGQRPFRGGRPSRNPAESDGSSSFPRRSNAALGARGGPSSGRSGERPFRKSGPPSGRSGERPFRGGSGTPSGRGGERPSFHKPSGRTAFAAKDGLNQAQGLELRAIINRELPEASRQVRETQDLLLTSAGEIIELAEKMLDLHLQIDANIQALISSQPALEEALAAIRADFEEARKQAATLFEKTCFQDLAGQRLNKVEVFCQALDRVLPSLAGKSGRKRPGAADDRPYSERQHREHKPKAELKGPQAAGQGLDQGKVDELLAGEDDG